jgi:DNA-binding CsgD family transcriptional regulator
MHEEARQKKFGLIPRELEIVSAVLAGYSNKEIAEYFKISEDTVKLHLSNIFDKLGVSRRLELALCRKQLATVSADWLAVFFAQFLGSSSMLIDMDSAQPARIADKRTAAQGYL